MSIISRRGEDVAGNGTSLHWFDWMCTPPPPSQRLMTGVSLQMIGDKHVPAIGKLGITVTSEAPTKVTIYVLCSTCYLLHLVKLHLLAYG